MLTTKPFQDLIALIEAIDEQAKIAENKQKTSNVLKNKDLFSWPAMRAGVSSIQGKCSPQLSKIHICIFASSYEEHGDVDIVIKFVEQAKSGDAKVNRLCVPHGLGLRVFELAPDTPHVIDPPWTEAACMQAVAFGMEVAASEGDILGLTVLAPGSDIQAKKLLNVVFADPDKTDSGDSGNDQISVLENMRNFAGREIAALVGGILAAKSQKMVVMIEEWAGLAAVAVLDKIQPGFCSHVFCAAPVDEEYAAICKKLNIPVILSISGAVEAGCSLAIGLSVMASSGSL